MTDAAARRVTRGLERRRAGAYRTTPPCPGLDWRPEIGQRYGRGVWLRVSELEQRINEIMDWMDAAGEDHEQRAAAVEEYLRLAYTHRDDEQFDVGAWSQTLADSYLALGRVPDAVRTIRDATRRGYGEGAEMLCDLAEKLMRLGH